MVLLVARRFRALRRGGGWGRGDSSHRPLIGAPPPCAPSRRTWRSRRTSGSGRERGPSDLGRIDPASIPRARRGAAWEPSSGYGDPSAVTAGFAAAARRRGAVIEQGTEVVAIRHQAGRVVGVDTATGERIDAPVVINAAGLWAPRVARLAGVELPIVIGRHPVFTVARDAGFGPAHTVYLDLAGGSYVRPETGDLTLTGSLTDDRDPAPR